MEIIDSFKNWYNSEPNSLIYVIIGSVILLILLSFMFKGKIMPEDKSVKSRAISSIRRQ